MSAEIGTATSVQDFLTKLDTFLRKGHSLDPAYTGTGNGTVTALIGTATSVLEVITVTFTSATAFDVAGSVSGSLGSGTVGVAFTASVCAFTLVAGGTAWVAGDTIVFTMTAPWTRKRAANVGSGTDEYIWQAPGNDNTAQIFVGALRFLDGTGDYDNLRLGGFTGYNAGAAFASQPGALARPILPLMRVGSMPYWFIANGRRVVIIAKCSTVYESAYLGFLAPYANPTAFPYPLLVGGSMSFTSEPAATSTNWKWSYQGNEHRAFPLSWISALPPGDMNVFTLRMRKADGSWFGFTAYNRYYGGPSDCGYIWPYSNGMTDLRPNLDASYPLFPIVLSEDFGFTSSVDFAYAVPTSPNMHGELDGVMAVTGHGNAAENIVTVGRTNWLVVQNVFRNTKADYFAVKLA